MNFRALYKPTGNPDNTKNKSLRPLHKAQTPPKTRKSNKVVHFELPQSERYTKRIVPKSRFSSRGGDDAKTRQMAGTWYCHIGCRCCLLAPFVEHEVATRHRKHRGETRRIRSPKDKQSVLLRRRGRENPCFHNQVFKKNRLSPIRAYLTGPAYSTVPVSSTALGDSSELTAQ